MYEAFDSHCHPQLSQYDADREEMLKRNFEAGISMICVGTDLETSEAGVLLAQKHEKIWATVGLHPNDNLEEKFDAEKYAELLKKDKVVAVGEIGLDYYRTTDQELKKIQRERFEIQLDFAIKNSFPVVLHSRDASKGSTGVVHQDMLAILKRKTPIGFVAHSFTGSPQEAEEYLKLGGHLGFNGILTFTGQYDETVRATPIDRILLETDAPFLAPGIHRGKRNESIYIVEAARRVAAIKGLALEEVLAITADNTKKLFRINNTL